MNQTQRKYAIARMTDITNRKIRDVQAAFNNRPENINTSIPYEMHASVREILLALMGEEVPGVTLKSRAEIMDELNKIRGNGNHAVYLSRFAKPVNHAEIEAAHANAEAINRRRETQLDVAVNTIKAENLRWQDAIMLGDDAEVMAALAAFEAFEATPVAEINV